MVQYSKGDTVQLYRGEIAIVLDSGLSGIEFCSENVEQIVWQVFENSDSFTRYIYPKIWENKYIQSHVWYPVLVGDKKAWLSEYIIPEYIRLSMQIASDEVKK